MAEPKKKSLVAVLAGASKKKKILVVGVLAALVVGAGGYLTVFKKAGPPPAPVAGAVLLLDPVHVNLADGRYLKVTMALQMTADAGAKQDGSKALDVAVTDLSLRRVSEMDTPAQRAAIKAELTTAIKKKYDKAVMDVYVIEFITQ
jgi:flagellar protein FliL